MCPTIPPPPKPFDPIHALTGLAAQYMRNAYGIVPDRMARVAALNMQATHPDRARALGRWLAGQGNTGAAALYMVRVKAWGAAHTLAPMPSAGQLGPVAETLRLYQVIAHNALKV